MAVRGKRAETQIAFLPEIIRPGQLTDEEYLDRAEGKIRGLGKLVASGMVEIGRELIGVKQRVGYQGMIDFATKRLRWSQRSTDRFVAVATMFSTAKLAVEELTIDASALYLLAQPTTTEEVRTAALEKAANGKLSHAEVKGLIEQATVDAEAKAKAAADKAASDHAWALAEEVRQHELDLARSGQRIAELETQAATAEQTVRAEYEAMVADKILVSEDELRERIEQAAGEMANELETLTRQKERVAKQLKEARQQLKQALDREAAAAKAVRGPARPPFDSDLSMRAMVVRNAVENLRSELKLTPAECIAIEVELSTRFHDKPALAHEKLRQTADAARDVIAWLQTFTDLARGLGK